MTYARRTIFAGTLADPDDFRLEGEPFRRRRVVLRVSENGRTESWVEVADLSGSGPDDRHFTLDRATGRVRFGDGERGRRPEAGSRVEASYGRRGGSAVTAIPFAAGILGFVTALLQRRRS